MKSIEEVKQFLMQYFEERRREGYVVVFDPLAEIYDVLSIGVGRVGNIKDLDDFFQLSIATSGDYEEHVLFYIVVACNKNKFNTNENIQLQSREACLRILKLITASTDNFDNFIFIFL